MTDFRKWNEFSPAFDLRREGYGIHGMEIAFYLAGPEGVIQFKVATDLYLPGSMLEPGKEVMGGFGQGPAAEISPHGWCPVDLGYHSYKPRYEGHSAMGKCHLLEGAECFYDGSTLSAGSMLAILVRDGHEAVWKEMEKYYRDTFE